MKIDVSNLTDKQIRKLGAHLKLGQCLMCGVLGAGLKRIPLDGGKVAALPLCARCQDTSTPESLASLMQITAAEPLSIGMKKIMR